MLVVMTDDNVKAIDDTPSIPDTSDNWYSIIIDDTFCRDIDTFYW